MKMLQQEIATGRNKRWKSILVLLILVEKDVSVHTTFSVCFPSWILDIDATADEFEDRDVSWER